MYSNVGKADIWAMPTKKNLVVKNLTFGMFTTPKVHFLDFEKLTAE